MKKKVVTALLTAAFISVSVCACGNTDSGESKTPVASEPTKGDDKPTPEEKPEATPSDDKKDDPVGDEQSGDAEFEAKLEKWKQSIRDGLWYTQMDWPLDPRWDDHIADGRCTQIADMFFYDGMPYEEVVQEFRNSELLKGMEGKDNFKWIKNYAVYVCIDNTIAALPNTIDDWQNLECETKNAIDINDIGFEYLGKMTNMYVSLNDIGLKYGRKTEREGGLYSANINVDYSYNAENERAIETETERIIRGGFSEDKLLDIENSFVRRSKDTEIKKLDIESLIDSIDWKEDRWYFTIMQSE